MNTPTEVNVAKTIFCKRDYDINLFVYWKHTIEKLLGKFFKKQDQLTSYLKHNPVHDNDYIGWFNGFMNFYTPVSSTQAANTQQETSNHVETFFFSNEPSTYLFFCINAFLKETHDSFLILSTLPDAPFFTQPTNATSTQINDVDEDEESRGELFLNNLSKMHTIKFHFLLKIFKEIHIFDYTTFLFVYYFFFDIVAPIPTFINTLNLLLSIDNLFIKLNLLLLDLTPSYLNCSLFLTSVVNLFVYCEKNELVVNTRFVLHCALNIIFKKFKLKISKDLFKSDDVDMEQDNNNNNISAEQTREIPAGKSPSCDQRDRTEEITARDKITNERVKIEEVVVGLSDRDKIIRLIERYCGENLCQIMNENEHKLFTLDDFIYNILN